MLRSLPGRLGVVAGTVVGTAVLLLSTRRAHADGALAPPSYPWTWNSLFKGIDMKRFVGWLVGCSRYVRVRDMQWRWRVRVSIA